MDGPAAILMKPSPAARGRHQLGKPPPQPQHEFPAAAALDLAQAPLEVFDFRHMLLHHPGKLLVDRVEAFLHQAFRDEAIPPHAPFSILAKFAGLVWADGPPEAGGPSFRRLRQPWRRWPAEGLSPSSTFPVHTPRGAYQLLAVESRRDGPERNNPGA